MYFGVTRVTLACFVLALLSGCALPSSDAVPISIFSESITLEWDPPAIRFPSSPKAISSYRIYYSNHNSRVWLQLGETPATDHPMFHIRYTDVGDGLFDFAISSVNDFGTTSVLHTSLDFTSSPIGGWYIRWILSR